MGFELEDRREMRSAPFDARFPNQNQTKNCWQNYVDYQRCLKVMEPRGVDAVESCTYFRRLYKSLCFAEWHKKWDEQLENGTFPAKI